MTDEKSYPKFRRGFHGYALMLRLLMDQPRTTIQMAEAIGTEVSATRTVIGQMRARKLIHASSWTKDKDGRTYLALWGCGDLPDAIPPLNRRGKVSGVARAAKLSSRLELTCFSTFMECLKEPHTLKSLVEATGVSYGVINRAINFMRGLKMVRIAEWDRTLARAPTAMFQLGEGRPAERPKPQTKAQLNSRWTKVKQAKRDHVRVMNALRGNARTWIPNVGSFTETNQPKETHDCSNACSPQ